MLVSQVLVLETCTILLCMNDLTSALDLCKDINPEPCLCIGKAHAPLLFIFLVPLMGHLCLYFGLATYPFSRFIEFLLFLVLQ